MREPKPDVTLEDVVSAAMSAIKNDCFGAEILENPDTARDVEKMITVVCRIAFTHHMDYFSMFDILGPLSSCPKWSAWVDDVRLALREVEFLDQFEMEFSLDRLLGVFDTVNFMMYVLHTGIPDGMVTTDATGKLVIWDCDGQCSKWPKVAEQPS